MKRQALFIAILVLAGTLGSAAAGAAPDTTWSYDALFDQFRAQKLDRSRCAKVASLLIQRDAATLALEEGDLVMATPVGGRVRAAVFTGRGSFVFAPASEVEREQLRRFSGVPLLRIPFDQLTMIFSDSSEAELAMAATFGPGQPGRGAEEVLARTLNDISHAGSHTVKSSLGRSLVERSPDGHFSAAIHPISGKMLYLDIDPYSTEEVMLLRSAEGPKAGGLGRIYGWDLISKFRLGGRSSDDLESDERTPLRVHHVAADFQILKYTDIRASARLRAAVKANAEFVVLALYERLVVDSVLVDGRPTRWSRGKDSPLLWIQCTPPLEAGDSVEVAVSYHGPLIRREGDSFWLESNTTWLPLHEPLVRSTYDLTFHHPSDLQLASIHERVSTETKRGITTSHWVCERPVQYASFNLGFMKEHQVTVKGIPSVTVLISTEHDAEWAKELAEEGIASGKDMEKQVGADVANSLAFFQKVYGTLPVKQLFATETPIPHGVSFPGMIALYAGTFQYNAGYGTSELFRSHEVAHQWWPYGVGPRTYHDTWLSEGFAQFSSLWFLQTSPRTSKRYFDVLEKWRKTIVEGQRQKLGTGLRIAPTWLGPRARVNAAEGAYQTAIYDRGAWILHMLRNLLLDLDTMNDERFRALMKDFYQTYEGREASTQDFRRVAEKHAGQDLEWFFKQWVYRTDVPAYRFAWKSEPAAGGKFRVRCRIEQREVPEGFRMSVPILIDFGDPGHARFRADVRGPTTELELPLLDYAPKQLVFNDLASVLCEVENVAWR